MALDPLTVFEVGRDQYVPLVDSFQMVLDRSGASAVLRLQYAPLNVVAYTDCLTASETGVVRVPTTLDLNYLTLNGAAGTASYVLTSNGPGLPPTWQSIGAVSAHALLDGVVNNDTLAAGPTRGDLIVANSTPKWARFAVGATGTYLAGGTDPSWATLASAAVTSITGTANQVIASASVGAVTLSLPQSIATSSLVQFGKLGLGVAPTRFLDVLGTTEQMRLAYDASNYNAFTVSSVGSLTIAATGTNPNITLTPGGTGYTILNGNVGIGTTGPSKKLHIQGAGQTTAALTDAGNAGGTMFADTSDESVNSGGDIRFGTTNHPFAAIKALLVNGSGNYIGDLAFSTRNATGDTALTERMRISTGGGVGIGGISPDSGTKVQVAGGILTSGSFSSTVGSTGGIDYSGGGLRFFSMGTSGATKGTFTWIAKGADNSSTTPMTLGATGGLQLGAPTGGDLGTGTLNVATAIYLNNTAYTNPDYVLEHWATGQIVKHAANRGAADYPGLFPLAAVEAYARRHYILPLMDRHRDGDLFERGDLLYATVEEAYLYLFDIEKRLKAVEATLH